MRQPNAWSCLPACFCRCTGVDFSELISAIGHDGSDIVDPSKPEPFCRAAFLFDEVALAALTLGWALTRFFVHVENTDGSPRPCLPERGGVIAGIRSRSILEVNRGTEQNPEWHCLTYDGITGRIFDPFTCKTWDLEQYAQGPGWPITMASIPTRVSFGHVHLYDDSLHKKRGSRPKIIA